jgi:superfamily II DNA or RNA helicase
LVHAVEGSAPQAWEVALEKVRSRSESSPRGRAIAGEPRALRYELNVRESRLRDQLVIDFVEGEDGRPFVVDEAGIEALPKREDRELLRILLGNVGEDRHRAHLDPKVTYSRSVVRPGLYDLVLLRLSASGRLFVRDVESSEKADYDEGEPFELTLTIEAVDGGYALAGFLRRGADRIVLSDLSLVLSGGLAVAGPRVLRIETRGFEWLYRLHRQGPIVVPKEAKDELCVRLASMPDLPDLELPPELSWSAIAIEPRPRCVFSSSPDGARSVAGRIEFDYAGQIVEASSRRTQVADAAGRRLVRRHLTAERQAIARIAELGIGSPEGGSIEVAPRDLTRVIRTLLEDGWSVEAEGAEIRPPGRLESRVSSGIDWFDLSSELHYGDVTASLPELLEAVERGSPWVSLSDGSRGLLPDWLDRYAALAKTAKVDGACLRFLPSQAGILDALLTGHDASVDVKFERLRVRLDRRSDRLPAEPAGFFGRLRPYQREGLAWLEFLEASGYGGCLADDMGLGKTIQVLSMLQGRHAPVPGAKPKRAPSLIVVPKSLVHNWIAEARKFVPAMKVLDYTGPDRAKDRIGDHDVVVTTYGTVRQDVLDLLEVRFSTVILDEAQAIKNPRSQAAKACRLLFGDQRLAITGTPIENDLEELWSIFEFLNPGMLGRFADFTANAKSADDAWLGLLRASLRPVMLRRTKEQVLSDLPPKTEQTIEVELEPKEREAYDELRAFYRSVLTRKIEELGFGKAKIHVLEALLRLRQAACHPGLIDASRMDEPSAKVDALVDKLCEVVARGHKALVFSQFTTLLEIVRRRLDRAGLAHCYLDGQTRDRKAICDEFQTRPELSVFLISLKAGGCGLNLTASDYVFILDPWWNPAVERQAIDRAHRMGQEHPVFAYRLISTDTVEEKIVALKEQKKRLADAIVTADGRGLRDLTADDLASLFGAGPSLRQ